MKDNKNLETILYAKYFVDENDDMRIVSVDENFEQILGYTSEYIQKNRMRMSDIFLEEDWEDYISMVSKQVSEHGEAYLAHRLKKADGDSIYVFCFGKVTGVSGEGHVISEIMITDITGTRSLALQAEKLIHDNENLQNDIREHNKLMELAVNNMAGGVGVFVVDTDKISMEFVSDSFYKVFKVNKEQIADYIDNFILLVTPDDRSKLTKQIRETISGNKSTIGEIRFTDINSQKFFWVQVCLSVLTVRDGKFVMCAAFFDISERKDKEFTYLANNELMKLAIEGSNELIAYYDVTDDNLRVTRLIDGVFKDIHINTDFCKTISESKYIHPDDKEMVRKTLLDMRENVSRRTLDFRYLNEAAKTENNSEFAWYRIHLVSVADENNIVKKIVGKFYSVHVDKMENVQLTRQAELDSLTAIYNHSTFESRIIDYLKENHESYCVFFMLDIDDFKLINDAMGHYMGDLLLKDTAKALDELITAEHGIAGRMGGDEFAAFVPKLSGKKKAMEIAAKISDKLSGLPFDMVHTVSVGAAVMKNNGKLTQEELYSAADQALYVSKRQGKNRYTIYGDNMEQHVSVSHMQNEADVSNDELVLENSKDIIYISDPNTHELVYMNRAARKASQLPLEGTDYVGRKCYEVIQKKDKPCEFCTNSKLKKNQNYIWCHNNKAVNAKYVLKDSLVIWNGKKCRMEVAMDISDDNKIAGIVAERMEVEDALTECIWRITSDVNFKTSYIKFLETLGSFYGAKRACIIMYDEIDGIYEWKSSNLNYLGDKLSIFSKEVVNEELRLRNKGGIVEDILIYGHGEGVYSNNQGIMSFVNDNRIWSMYATPILDDKKEVIGITVIFNPQKHLGDIRILNMLSAYVAKAYANRNR